MSSLPIQSSIEDSSNSACCSVERQLSREVSAHNGLCHLSNALFSQEFSHVCRGHETESRGLSAGRARWYRKTPPNGSRLSCGRLARRRKGGGRQSVLARGTT